MNGKYLPISINSAKVSSTAFKKSGFTLLLFKILISAWVAVKSPVYSI